MLRLADVDVEWLGELMTDWRMPATPSRGSPLRGSRWSYIRHRHKGRCGSTRDVRASGARRPRPPALGGLGLDRHRDLSVLGGRVGPPAHGTSWPVLFALNSDTVADPDRIFIGQSLRLP